MFPLPFPSAAIFTSCVLAAAAFRRARDGICGDIPLLLPLPLPLVAMTRLRGENKAPQKKKRNQRARLLSVQGQNEEKWRFLFSFSFFMDVADIFLQGTQAQDV